jgi:hypothetical protein
MRCWSGPKKWPGTAGGRVEYARYADDLVTLVDGYRRHAWLGVAEVALASPSPAGAWILRNAETGDVNFASLPGTRALAGLLCLRLQRPIMADYVTLRRSQHGAGAAGERSC